MVTEQSLGVSTAQQLSGTNFQDNNFLLAGVRISFQTSQNWRREEKTGSQNSSWIGVTGHFNNNKTRNVNKCGVSITFLHIIPSRFVVLQFSVMRVCLK